MKNANSVKRGAKNKRGPFKGRVNIANNSSLRKLARALRRGLVPAERMFTIETAMMKREIKA